MNNTINLDEYLSDDEKKDIAVRVFTDKLMSLSQAEIERIVSNNAYEIARDIVDKNFDKEFKQSVKDKLPEIINGLSSYTVFDRGDGYGAFKKGATVAWQTVELAVKENEDALKDRVREVISGIDDVTLRDKISEAIYDAVTTPIKETVQ